jgi:glycerophosphoryl diester phosphodiesterase
MYLSEGMPQYIPKFDVQGHRGARGLRPENTLPAFLLALDSGVTTLELDLCITKDGQVVVSHEPYMSAAICMDPAGQPVTPATEKGYNIFHMTYEEVKQFDCGLRGNEKFPEQVKMSAVKPLLRDVIVAVEDHIKSVTRYEVDYNLEIKSSPEGDGEFHPHVEEFVDRVVDLADQYLPLERVVIQSFDVRVLKYAHTKYPQIRLALLVENMKSIDWNLNNLGFKPSIYSPYFKLIKKDHVRYVHDQQIRIIPWTVNDPEDMKRLKSWGVDGLITDYPDRASTLGFTLKRKPMPKP